MRAAGNTAAASTAAESGFSTDMSGYLDVGGRRLPLGQLGPAHCIVRDAVSIAPAEAEIVVITDGRESRTPVYLPEGISSANRRVIYESRPVRNQAIPA